MSSGKKKEPKAAPAAAPSTPAPRKASSSGGLAQVLRGPARWLILAVIICGAVGGAGYALWQAIGPQVLHQPQYQLTAEQIEITPPPAWIHAPVRDDVFHQGGLDNSVWIHDADLAERVSKAFTLHPWVAKVERVTKRAPARVVVDLVYRKPVCVVEVSGATFPVDAEGVLLPRDDFPPAELRRYPRLSGVQSFPSDMVGRPWGDLHVVGGAEIAAVLLDQWDDLRLERIVVSGSTGPSIVYELLERHLDGQVPNRIIWGHAPGIGDASDASVDDKIAALKQFLAERSRNAATGGPVQIDLRQARPPQTARTPDTLEKVLPPGSTR